MHRISRGTFFLTPVVRWFLMGVVLSALAQNMVLIFLPLYLSQLGASVAQVGMVLSLSSLLRVLLQIPTGWISDTVGRLRVLAIGSSIGFMGFLGMILTKDWRVFLLTISIESITSLAIGPNYGPFLVENARRGEVGRVLGVSEMVFRIVYVVGPLLGGFFASRFGIRNMLIVAAIPYALAILVRIWMARTVIEPVTKRIYRFDLAEFRSSLKVIVGLAVAGGLFTWTLFTKSILQITSRLSMDLMPLYLEQVGGLTVEQISVLGAISGIAIMALSIPSGILSDQYGEHVAISFGQLLSCLALATLINVHTFVGFTSSWLLLGASNGMLSPSYMSIISKVIPEKNKGLSFGLVWTSMGLIGLPVAWIGGYLWERFNPQLPFLLTAIASLVMAGIAWCKLKPRS